MVLGYRIVLAKRMLAAAAGMAARWWKVSKVVRQVEFELLYLA